MKTCFLPLLLSLFISFSAHPQDFPYGAVTLNDLTMTRYDFDSTAGAVVLKEFGEAYVSAEDYQNSRFRMANSSSRRKNNTNIT
ncbi:MAG: hypothetical protein WEB30_03345 [Cyclobacteriaceae bacterium]